MKADFKNIALGLTITAALFSIPFIIKRKKINHLKLAFDVLKLSEAPGKLTNPQISQMFEALGFGKMDEITAWCSAFVGWILKRSGHKYIPTLKARDWLAYPGPTKQLDELKPGDIVILWRVTQTGNLGHVGFYIDQDSDNIYILGGNQADQVNITPFKKMRFLGGKTVI